MVEVERLLTASMVRVTSTGARDPAARGCLAAYFAELVERFPGGFDPARSVNGGADDLSPPAGLMLVAMLHDDPVGCAGMHFHDDWAQIKRMWVAPAVRGLGLGRRLLSELEATAAAHGRAVLRLETHRVLTEAITLYRRAGYVEVAPFNAEPYAHHWFEKRLPAPVPAPGPAAAGPTGAARPAGPGSPQ
jgi:GNAT superfamily N-acetyltransferase